MLIRTLYAFYFILIMTIYDMLLRGIKWEKIGQWLAEKIDL